MVSVLTVSYSVVKVIAAADTVTSGGNSMARVDEREELPTPMSTRPARTHRWIGPLLGAVLGFVLGTGLPARRFAGV